ncbi:MAG: translation initiation factor IF-2 [Anaerovoracaceae bacterium]
MAVEKTVKGKGVEQKRVKVAPKKVEKEGTANSGVQLKATKIKDVEPMLKATKIADKAIPISKVPMGKPVVPKEVRDRGKVEPPKATPLPKAVPKPLLKREEEKETPSAKIMVKEPTAKKKEVEVKAKTPIVERVKAEPKVIKKADIEQKYPASVKLEKSVSKSAPEEEIETKKVSNSVIKGKKENKVAENVIAKENPEEKPKKPVRENRKVEPKKKTPVVLAEPPRMAMPKIVKRAEEDERLKKEEQERREKEAAKEAAKKKRLEKQAKEEGEQSKKKPKAAAAKTEDGKASTTPAKGKKGKEKERNKFSKFERPRKPARPNYEDGTLEKKVKGKKSTNRPKVEIEIEEEVEAIPFGTKIVNVPITVAGLSEQLEISVSNIIMGLMKLGIVSNINQVMDKDTVELLASELGVEVIIGEVNEEIVEEGIEDHKDDEKHLTERPPIITVMGHVDHGKTSLLDAIRKTSVTESESGGITQHIGASEVYVNDKKIVFLDTPGHEAFTAMRARGADITDIAVLVVAADDGVKPQTIESISHAKAAGVPIIVAINKIDKPGANLDRVKQDLTEHGLLVEDWGGDIISVPVSAKSGEGIQQLLEMILLQAEVQELKANPDRLGLGTVIEARLDKAKGPVATLLVTNGTLRTGASIVAGTAAGRIRLMTNFKGDAIHKATPGTAVEILGLNEVPLAGDTFNAVSDDKKSKEIAERRKDRQREEVMATTSSSSLEALFSQMQEGELKELNLIVKGDVGGSVDAVVTALEKLTNENIRVKIVHSDVGTINSSDLALATTTGSIIIGFNVRPTMQVTAAAEKDNVEIRTYRVIYNIIEDIEKAMTGMLDPEYKEVVLGSVEIRETFKVPDIGYIGGAYVTDGKVVRNAKIRLLRDGVIIHEGKISSLKRFKDDAKEVSQGFECGIGIENYNDIKAGDTIECYQMEEIKRD